MALIQCKFHLVAIVFIFVATVDALSTEEMAKRKPHVILMVSDDLGWNDVSWNNPNVVMPHMHDLATGGVILNQSYVQPTCTPTRAALMTGRYPFKMGLQQGVIGSLEPSGVPTRFKMIPKVLRKVGYSSHAIGKWHLGFCSRSYTPLWRGFDSFYGFLTGSEDYYTHSRTVSFTKGSGDQAKRIKDRTEYLDLRNNTNVDKNQNGVYSTYLFASAAEEVINSRNSKDPMFMYLAFQSVHSPLQVPRKYSNIYGHVKNHDRKVYLGMVTAMDEAVGRVIKALKKTGHYENSVIIFTTDNGGAVNKGASNWPLRGLKNSLWEGGTRGPAFIHSPLLPNPGTVSEKMHHATDWYSTILSIAGASVPKVDGVNQWDALAGLSEPARDKMVLNMDDSKKYKAGVRIGDYKLLVGGMALNWWVSPPQTGDELRKKIKKGSSKKNIKKSNKKNKKGSNKKNKKGSNKNRVSRARDIDFGTSLQGTVPPLQGNAELEIPDVIVEKDEDKEEEEEEEEEEELLEPGEVYNYFNVSSLGNDHNISLNTKERSTLNRQYLIDYVYWKNLRNDYRMTWNPEVLSVLDKYLREKTKIRLFNVKDDPEERQNLSETETSRVQSLLTYLTQELQQYTPPLSMEDSRRGLPGRWKGVWSPGWCTAKW